MIDIMPILTALGTAVLRSVTGWLENALQDGQIDEYEWGQLGATVLRVVLITIGLQYSLNLEPIAAAAGAFVTDFIVSKLTK